MNLMRAISFSLKQGHWVGMFPEGTTNKNPDHCLLQEPKDGAFILVMRNKAVLQPIALTWLSEADRQQAGIRAKLLVNFCPPLQADSLAALRDGWVQAVTDGILENRLLLQQGRLREKIRKGANG